MPTDSPLGQAITRALGPLIRLVVARGVPFQELSDWLKELYLAVATRHFTEPGKRITVSRLSVLTGLQRKDIKAIRARLETNSPGALQGAGHLPRVIAHWRAAPGYQDGAGRPLALPRTSGNGASFEALVAEISRDVHPRSVLDALVRLDLVVTDGSDVCLTAEAFVPGGDQAALMHYLGANLGDHAQAAVENVLTDDTPAPNFERAVHYNRLTPAALADLEALARRLQQQAMEQINARALAYQRAGRNDATATGRFRCGAYILSADVNMTEEPDQ